MEKLLFKNKQSDRILRSDKDHVCLLLNEEKKDDGYMYDIEKIECNTDDYLDAVKKYVTECIVSYDDSSAVNEFSIGGKKVWIPKDTRLGLRNNVSDTESIGGTEVTFWFNGLGSLTVKTEAAKKMLIALENYAFACYNVTAEHKANVEALTSVEDVLGYDYTKGYPDKLNFTL